MNAELPGPGPPARWPSSARASGPSPASCAGYLTVVPETRWLKHADHLQHDHEETVAHYEEHLPDLAAVLAGAGAR